MNKRVLTFNFEIAHRDKFLPKLNFENSVEIKQVKHDQYLSFVMFLGVGLPYAWGERLRWANKEWHAYLTNNDVYFYLGFANNSLIGYFEIHKHNNTDVEIKYFGLLPNYIGQGLGGAFLSHAVNQAYKLKAEKVWLHTCEFDGEMAIKNYEARGFKKVDEYYSSEFVPTPEESIELITEFYRKYLSNNT